MFDVRPMPKNCADCATCPQVEWSELGREGLDHLTRVRRTFEYQPGESIFHQNDDPKGIYCIEHGNILLRGFDAFGHETGFRVIVNGETIGWRSFFAEQPHAATALALTACRVCLISGTDLRVMMRDFPGLMQRFLKTLARDRGPAEGLLLRSPQLPVRIRVINLLLVLSRHIHDTDVASGKNGPTRFILPLKRQQIASMVGARNETLSRTLAALQEEGLVKFKGREVVIPDYGRLKIESERDRW